MRRIVEAVTVPVIANGDLYTQSDMARMLAESGCCGVMLARPGEGERVLRRYSCKSR